MSNIPDERLISLIKEGHNEAFNEIVIRYQDRIFNSILRYVGNYDDASDIIQQTFINAFKKIKGFKKQANLLTWLYKIAFNLSIDALRKRSRQRYVSFHYQKEEEEEGFQPAAESNPVSDLEKKELSEKVQSALNRLDNNLRIVVILREFEGYSYEEIASILEIPSGTVRSRLHKARLILRDKLAHFIRTFKEP
jgi:RNA polymerase sigma-70 factor (ECF subfamily)